MLWTAGQPTEIGAHIGGTARPHWGPWVTFRGKYAVIVQARRAADRPIMQERMVRAELKTFNS